MLDNRTAKCTLSIRGPGPTFSRPPDAPMDAGWVEVRIIPVLNFLHKRLFNNDEEEYDNHHYELQAMWTRLDPAQ